MFGRLTLESIPYTNPIIMSAVGMMVLVGLGILAFITRKQAWGYLWREWLCSVDHKRIGIMYIVLALVMLLRGFADALMMRLQQALALAPHSGYLPPEHYDQIFSAHGTIMIFFMAMPFLTGLINIVVPQQLGTRDVAFPFLNAASLWFTVSSAMLIMISLAIGEFSTAGWTAYPPYSELATSPGVGVDYWIWAAQISGIGSTLSGVNFLVTILRNRAPGMTLMRMPLFTWSALCVSILMILAFPALTVTAALLALDRYADMHFFTNGLGGNMMNYANLFWIWGHPEVYILILPAFGVYSEVVSTFSDKRLFGYHSLVWATVSIAVLSFTVWLHHFFTMGSSATVNAAFGIATMLIAVPTGVKLFNWLFTLFRGRIRFDTPMLWTLGFIPSFAVGGAAGVLLAIPPVDFQFHNSEFLVAHFHNMLVPGALFGFLAGYMYWAPKALGFKLNEYWGKQAFWSWLIGFQLAFLPLYALGIMGMPRRMDHYSDPTWQPLLIVAGIGALLILYGIVALGIQLYVSVRDREALADLTGDPWNGRTLEWATASPPPVYNFAVIPQVRDRDALTDLKERGLATVQPTEYQDIWMPKNTSAGFIMGAFSFVLGFALIWHIWWMAVLGLLGILFGVVQRSWVDEDEYLITAAEVACIEARRWARAGQVPNPTPKPCKPAIEPVTGAIGNAKPEPAS